MPACRRRRPTPDDTLLLAVAVKGLAATALTAVHDGRSAPRPQAEMLRAAYWRAARDGTRGQSINLTTGRLQPATRHLDELWNTALPALAPDDLTSVHTARHRHRHSHSHRHRHHDVVNHLIRQTTT
ncbi:hypothetical protein ABT084_18255 [Streptomyces sp. NPDC002138]|uniref:hypothetical protein n=1 Tax=Streptomyces sp. NPDC002138 TaxID=3154410 RepID=UPI00332A781F